MMQCFGTESSSNNYSSILMKKITEVIYMEVASTSNNGIPVHVCSPLKNS